MSDLGELFIKLKIVESLEAIIKSGNAIPAWQINGVILEYLKEQGFVEGSGFDSRGDAYIKASEKGLEFYRKYK